MVVLALACAPCLAHAEGWKLGGKELHPGIIIKGQGISSAWKKAVSSAKVPKKEQFWLQDMDGPGSANIVTGAGGRELVVGNTCRPHDCYDNNLVFVIDLANKQIWALRQGRGQSPKAKQFIGGPDAEMQQLLLQDLVKEFPDDVGAAPSPSRPLPYDTAAAQAGRVPGWKTSCPAYTSTKGITYPLQTGGVFDGAIAQNAEIIPDDADYREDKHSGNEADPDGLIEGAEWGDLGKIANGYLTIDCVYGPIKEFTKAKAHFYIKLNPGTVDECQVRTGPHNTPDSKYIVRMVCR